MTNSWRPRTQLVHGGIDRSPHGETCEALYLTSGFCYDCAEDAAARFADEQPGFMYSRVGNPTVRMFEERMAMLEGAEAGAATATGMAAVHAAIMAELRAGQRVVGARLLFGSCHYILTELLPRYGVEIELVDGRDLEAWAEALSKPTDLVFFETPGNPTLELVDIEAVSALAHRAGAKVIVDNVFATPMLQKPLALGADIVIYSATKHIDGQGRCLGGIVLADAAYRHGPLQAFLKNTGPALSPFNAWTLLKGLETLDLRVREIVRNATKVAQFLEQHPKVTKVVYPGLESHPQYALARKQMAAGSGLIAFWVGASREKTFAIMNRFKLISISNNLGDTKSLATHPASTTHARLTVEDRTEFGIDEDLIRVSIGLEDPDDLIDDLDQALQAL
ncbi:MAG: O-succinylhomoserine sulfhydrylase, partial [Pseudomonadota bacterium]